MDFGLTVVPTEHGAPPAQIGRMAEDLGFTSLFVPEHSHLPVDQRTVSPGTVDHWAEFAGILDPIVALTSVAAATSTLELGFGTVVLTLRDPILLAKAAATLDLVSGGRVLLGVGAGWNLDELANHGIDRAVRFPVFEEKVRAIKEIWSHDVAAFDGEHVRFDPLRQRPKPTRPGGIPILVGCQGPSAIERLLRVGGDGWLISGEVERDHAALGPRIAELQDRACAAGRGPIPVVLQRATADARSFELYERMGIDRCLLGLPSAPLSELRPIAEAHAALVHTFHAAA